METSAVAEQFFTGPDGECYSWTQFPAWVSRRYECRSFTLDFPIAGRLWRYVGEAIPGSPQVWQLVGGTAEPRYDPAASGPEALRWAASSLTRRSA